MDVRWLEDFLSLATHRSFLRSAQARHLSQAAFGRRIKAIEAWVGVPLVDRSEFPITLTAHGMLFRDAAEAALRTLEEARDLLRGAREQRWAAASVATGKSLALNFFPAWYASLRVQDNEVAARVVTLAMPDGALMLAESGVDFLLSYWNDEIPLLLDTTEFEHISVGRECLVPVCAAAGNMRSAREPRFTLPGRRGQPLPWLCVSENTRQGRVVRMVIERHSPAAHLQPVFEADFSEALVALTLRGLGIAWLPERAIAEALLEGRLLRAGDASWDAHFDIRFYRRRANRSVQVERLWLAVSKQVMPSITARASLVA